MKNGSSRLKGIGAGIALAFCFSFLAFVFAPFDLYLSNIDEFWLRISEAVIPVALMFAASFIFFSLFFIVLRLVSEKVYLGALTVCTALTLGVYVQGTFLIFNLPETNGGTVDWGSYHLERILSVLAFALPLAAAIFYIVKFRAKHIRKVTVIASVVLTFILAVSLTSLFVSTDTNKKETQFSSDKDEFLLSSDQNFIFLLLDATNGKAFGEEMAKDPELASLLNGFTYYDNTLSGYAYTARAMPFILSGEWYENEKPYHKYLTESLLNSPFVCELDSQDYKIGLYDNINYRLSEEEAGRLFDNYIYASVDPTSPNIYICLLKMAGMKFAPWDVKRFCWDVTDSFKVDADSENNIYGWWTEDLHDILKESNPITVTNEKCARLIHLEGSHVSFWYDKNFEDVEGADYNDKVGACITLIKEYVTRLKESGVYDNSAIVILSDHGFDGYDRHDEEDVVQRFNPILLMKGVGEKHPFAVSSAPISHLDLAPAFVKMINGEAGNEVFDYKDGDERVRRILLYMYTKENHLIEYVTDGTAIDFESYVKTGNTYDYEG